MTTKVKGAVNLARKALKMCGAQKVSMTEDTCQATGGPYCRYRVSWETAPDD